MEFENIIENRVGWDFNENKAKELYGVFDKVVAFMKDVTHVNLG